MERITSDFYRNRTRKAKRWLGLLTFCMMLVSMQTSAQIWTIDDCTPGSPLGSALYGPMNSSTNANATNRTAMFYPASQLAGIAGQELTGIYFNKVTSNDMTGSPYLKIYLKETTDTDFGAGALAWNDAILGATLVYEDNPAAAAAGSSGWKEFSFSSNYIYSGANNLVLITEYVNGGNTTSATWWYEYTNSCIDTSNSNTTKYVNNTTGVPGESLSSSNYRRPIIGFDFTVSCPAPTNVLLSDITTTGITINWTAGGTETDWEYAFQPIGSGVPATFSQTTSTTLTVNDLLPSTGYEFYVRANCGGSDGESVWKGPYEFYTACGVVTSGFYEGFEDTPTGGSTNPTVPQCWSFIDTGLGWGYTNSTTPQDGVRNFYMYNGSDSDTGHYILVSPETDNLGNGTMRVKFWARTTSTVTTTTTYLDFGTLSSNTDETTFTLVESLPLTNAYTEYVVIIPATTDDYFGFRHDLVTKARYTYIDSITYQELPSCLEPSDLTASNPLTDSVDLSWTSDGNLFDIEYGEAGFAQGTGTVISGITNNPYTLTGLSAMTSYDVYIRSDCGGGDISPWTSSISFMTACSSVTTLDENFDSYATGSIVPECWVRLTSATSTGSQTITSTTPASGTRNIYQYASATQNPVIVVLPEFSNINAGTHWLRFKARVGSGAPGALSVGYVTDETDYDSFVLLETLTINNTSYTVDDAEYTVAVPTSVPAGAKLAVKNSADAKSYYWDDVIWEMAPSCIAPSGLSHTQLSMTSADISWTSIGSLFDIEWGAQGFTQGSGTLVTDITTTSYQLTGLTTDAVYEFYVLQDCGATDGESTWAGPYSFSVGYCIPTGAANNADEIRNFTLNNLDNDSAASEGTAGYMNYSDTVAPALVQAGVPAIASLTSGTGSGNHGAAIWIDYNQNGVFDDSEKVAWIGNNIGASATVSFPAFTVPAETTPGIYRLRVMYRYNSSGETFIPCVAGSTFAEIEDYAISVTAPPSCLPPSGLSYTQLSITSAELSWTSTGSSFDIEWGVQGFTQGSGTMVTDNTTTSYQLTGLTTDVVYDFYVLQDCGTGGESTWTGPYSFSVGYCSSVPTSNDGQGITNVSLGSASFPVADVTYYNYTDSVIDIATGVTNASSVSFATGWTYNTNIWIDLNDDGIFDSSELVFQGESLATNPTTLDTSFYLDALANLGQHKMRIGTADSGQATPNPCYSGSYGVTVDLMVNVTTPPSCVAPSWLSHTPLSMTSTELSWTSAGSLFDIEWGAQGFTQGSGTLVTDITTTSYLLTDLTMDVIYEFYVLQDCGATDGESTWTGPYSFSLGYCTPYYDNGCTFGDDIDDFTLTGAGISHLGTGCSTGAYANYTNDPTLQGLVEQGSTYSFTATHGFGSQYVSIWIDFNDNGTFEASELLFTSTTGSAETTGSITIPADAPFGPHRMRVQGKYFSASADACSPLGYGETHDYTVVVTAAPCPEPTGFAASSVTTNSAELSWTGTSDSFDIEWGASGFTQGSGTTVTGVTSPYSLTGLANNTAYDVYIKGVCATNESAWIGPVSFTTLPDYCGVSTTYAFDYISGFSTTGATQNVTYTATSQPAGSYANETAQIIQQAQGLPIDFTSTYVSGSYALKIWVDVNNDYVFDETTEVVFFQYGASPQTGSVTVPVDLPVGDYRVRVRGQWGSTANPPACGEVNYGSTIDFTLQVTPAPSCLPPLGLSHTQLSTTSAELSWTSAGSLFDVEWGAQGFTQGSGTMVTDIATTSYQLTGLTTDAVYEFYVLQDCGTTDGESTWAGPYSFSVGYCSSVPTSYDNNGITNVSLGSVSFPVTPTSYYNYTDSVIDIAAGTTVASAVSFATGWTYNTNIWIDLNDDGIFDSSELVFQGESLATNPTTLDTSFYLDALANLGQHKMRIGTADGGQAIPNPCYSGSYGVTVDLMVNVTAPPSCLPPSGLSHTPLSMTSAELSWTSAGSLFDIEWGAQGFTQGSGTLVTDITTTSYLLTDLTMDVIYEFYVLQDCGATDGESTWTGPYSFSLGYCTPYYDNGCTFGDDIDDFTLTGAGISHLGTGCSTGAYANYTNDPTLQGLVEQGSTYSFTATHGFGGQYVSIWIDFNDNGTFEASELLFTSTTGSDATTGSITIPADAPFGPHRMRVQGKWNSASADACSPLGYGETHDYTVTVIDPCASVLAPTGDAAQDADLGDTLADLDVTASGTLTWYSDVTLTTVVSDTTEFDQTGTFTYWVTNTEGACESGALEVTVTVTDPCANVLAPTGDAAQDADLGDTLADLDVTASGTLTWYSDVTLTTVVSDTTEFDQTGTFTYWVTNTEGACESGALEVTVTVTDPCANVLAPTGDAAQDADLGDTLADLDVTASGTLTWYSDVTLTTVVSDTTEFDQTGTFTYWVTNTEGDCVSGALEVTVTVTDPCASVLAPTGDGEQDVDLGDTLADLDVTASGTLTWYSDVTLTTVVSDTTEFDQTGTFTYWVTNTEGDCVSGALEVTVTVTDPCAGVTPPTADSPQTLTEGQTVADIVVTDVAGTLNWYSDADLTISVDETDVLTEGQYTFWVTQTVGDCTSDAIEIEVEVTLSRNIFDAASFRAYPNPVNEILNISYSKDITNVAVINMLGQVVISQTVSSTNTQVDMSALPTGNYLVKVTVEGAVRTIKVVKQ